MWKGALICINSKNVSYLDCLWGELYSSINDCQWDRSITKQKAEYLREKYL